MSFISKVEFGWVQNPNDFKKLKKTVSILNPQSNYHKWLLHNFNKFEHYTKSHVDHWKLIKAGLYHDPVKLRLSQVIGSKQFPDNYTHLGPRSRWPRSQQAPFGLAQVSARSPRNSNYCTDDWTSRGYVNWALTLHFWELDYSNNLDDPLVKLTKSGKDFSESPDDPYINKMNKPKKCHQVSIMEMLLRSVMISYPPVVRILELLNEHQNELVSKFQLGNKLGFIGEPGFTSFDEKNWINQLMSRPLPNTPTAKWLSKHNFSNPDRSKFRSDAEGSADKWARTIASWLCKLKLVDQKRKNIPNVSDKYKGVYIPQAYKIRPEGKEWLKKAHGYSKHQPHQKYISWQMLATKVPNSDYVRIRRAYTIKYMEKFNDLKDIAISLKSRKLFTSYKILKNDIYDLHCFGLYFNTKPNFDPSKYKIDFKDNINDFSIPKMPQKQAITQPKLHKIMIKYAHLFTNLNANDLQLIELSQIKTSTRSRNTVEATLFEERVVKFMKQAMHLKGVHLGGPRKPDGALYYDNKLGIILDTKQYHKGYSLPINQQREMIDYIRNYQRKDLNRPWWKAFPSHLSNSDTYYLWVAYKFTGQYQRGLDYTHQQTKMNGAAMPIISLLDLGNKIIESPNKVTIMPKLMQNTLITKTHIENLKA